MVGGFYGDGESIFFKSMAPSKATMFQVMAPCPEVYIKHKLNLMDY